MAIIGKAWTPDQRLQYIYSMIKVDMKGIELDFYQDALIRSIDKFMVILKARQVGWSFLVALRGIVFALDPARVKYTKQFISYNEEDAREKIRYAQEFYDSIPAQFRKKIKYSNTTTMEFWDQGGKSTSRLISIACRPPRGKNGDISYDEMAFYPVNRCRSIYTAGVNAIIRGGRIEIGSTPLGTIGLFYDICTDRENFGTYVPYTIPWWFSRVHCNDVERAVELAPAMVTEERVYTFGNKDLINLYKTNFLEDFQQEQECAFIDSKGSYISLELIYANTPGMREGDRGEALEDDNAEEEAIEIYVAKTGDELVNIYDKGKHGELYLGYDIARRRDASVIYAIGNSNKKISLADIEMRNTPFEEQIAIMRFIIHTLHPVRCCVDQTGMGEPICERLQGEFGDRIEGIPFTNEIKGILAMNIKRGLENREFLLPNSQAFHLQIHSIKQISTQVGKFRYDAERTAKGHADSFWAWALAYHALTNGDVKLNYWEERALKKNQGTVSSGDDSGTRPRGKTAEAVLRGMMKGMKGYAYSK
jgi:phage FluMu gp28-like protein